MSITLLNGKMVDSASSPSAHQVQLAAAAFTSAGYMSGINNGNVFQANLVLGVLNITVSRETR